MIGLDTNVLVRYIMQDDVKQARLATKQIESLTVDEPGFVGLVAMVELTWVLSSAYELDRKQITAAMETLLRTIEIKVENADIVWQAVRRYAGNNADFADCLIERSAAAKGCSRTMTFDRGAAKHCAMTLIS